MPAGRAAHAQQSHQVIMQQRVPLGQGGWAPSRPTNPYTSRRATPSGVQNKNPRAALDQVVKTGAIGLGFFTVLAASPKAQAYEIGDLPHRTVPLEPSAGETRGDTYGGVAAGIAILTLTLIAISSKRGEAKEAARVQQSAASDKKSSAGDIAASIGATVLAGAALLSSTDAAAFVRDAVPVYPDYADPPMDFDLSTPAGIVNLVGFSLVATIYASLFTWGYLTSRREAALAKQQPPEAKRT